jgi:hypothetical protein
MSKTIDELIVEYMQLGDAITELQKQQREIKEAVATEIGPAEPGQTWAYDGVGAVTCVKGRTTKKLNPVLLMQNGVSSKLINECTEESVGKPHLRITPPEE